MVMRIIKSLVFILLILDLYLCYRVIWADRGFKDYSNLIGLKREFLKKIKDTYESNVELSKEIELIKHNREFKEKMIRKILRYGRDGEILYIVPKHEKPNNAR